MPDESVLREKARDAVRAGKLPSRRPDRTWGGEAVEKDQLEFEIQFVHEGAERVGAHRAKVA
jgi:hypothetical protein